MHYNGLSTLANHEIESNVVRFYNKGFHFLAEFVSALAAFAEDAGLMAFRILDTFQAVLTACPALANTCSVASPASSPNLLQKHHFSC